nr:hypothetical protein OH826_10000 [Streptomyces sp. NBC_00899]WSX79764.1 hypothetical protein OH826_41510 [Streptomyces sp. NBC_00899]
MPSLRPGVPVLLVAASAAMLTACGKAGAADAHVGARLPTARTLAEADQQLHAYLLDVLPAGAGDSSTRAGAVQAPLPGQTGCNVRGQATHVVTETVLGARDGYATDVVGAFRHRGWHIVGWNGDTPDGSRVTDAAQAGYRLVIRERSDTVDVAIETPCLQGDPLPKRSDFPDDSTDGKHA